MTKLAEAVKRLVETIESLPSIRLSLMGSMLDVKEALAFEESNTVTVLDDRVEAARQAAVDHWAQVEEIAERIEKGKKKAKDLMADFKSGKAAVEEAMRRLYSPTCDDKAVIAGETHVCNKPAGHIGNHCDGNTLACWGYTRMRDLVVLRMPETSRRGTLTAVAKSNPADAPRMEMVMESDVENLNRCTGIFSAIGCRCVLDEGHDGPHFVDNYLAGGTVAWGWGDDAPSLPAKITGEKKWPVKLGTSILVDNPGNLVESENVYLVVFTSRQGLPLYRAKGTNGAIALEGAWSEAEESLGDALRGLLPDRAYRNLYNMPPPPPPRCGEQLPKIGVSCRLEKGHEGEHVGTYHGSEGGGESTITWGAPVNRA